MPLTNDIQIISAKQEQLFYNDLKQSAPSIVPITYRFTECAIDKTTYFLQLQELYDGNVLDLYRNGKENRRSVILEPMINIAIQLGKLGILHADLKPDNFLYKKTKENGYRIVVTDFARCSYALPNTTLNIGWTLKDWECKSLRIDIDTKDPELDSKLQWFAIYVNVQCLVLALLKQNLVEWLDDTRRNKPEPTWIYRFTFPDDVKPFLETLLPECPGLRSSQQKEEQRIETLFKEVRKKRILFSRQYAVSV
jgi:serine/threonine protein kinase